MTTTSWTSPSLNTSTATFQAWGSELSAKFALVGCVQTADTGQINWLTVAWTATINTAQGYEIWRNSDSSIFFKVEYGTGSTNLPSLWITAGTGSNGSGTITGAAVLGRSQVQCTSNIASGGAAVPSYLSASTGHISLVFKVGAVNANVSQSFFVIAKTADSTGAYINDGLGLLVSNNGGNNATLQCCRFTGTPFTGAASTYFGFIPGNPASSIADGNFQAYHTWMNAPGVRPFPGSMIYKNNDIGPQVTFTIQPIGTTNRTYLTALIVTSPVINGQSNASLAFLYE
jgi:hypothetical protein